MTDAPLLAAMRQVVVVAVHQVRPRKNLVGQVRVAVPVPEFVEQPVRRPIEAAATAIGIECRGVGAGFHCGGYIWVALPMPCLVKEDIGRMAQALANLE